MKQDRFLQRYITVVTHPLFACIWVGLMITSYFYWDQPIAYFMHHLTHVYVAIKLIAQMVTYLGVGKFYIPIFFLLFLFGYFLKWPKMTANSLFIFLAMIIPGIICIILKILLGRARPVELFHHHEFGFYFFKTNVSMWSFPSGHSTLIASLMMAIALLWPRWAKVCISLMFLVAFSRVVVTAHYLSDVMAGLYLGTLLVIYLHRKLQELTWRPFEYLTSKQVAL